MRKRKNIGNSLVFIASIRIMLIVSILLAVLIISNVYSLNVLTKNTVSSTQNTMTVYINNLQNSLNSSTKDINEISLKYINNIINYDNADELGKYLSATELKGILVTKIISNENLDGLFILQHGEDLFLAQFSNRILSNEIMSLSNYLDSENYYDNNKSNNVWNIIKLNGTCYLIKKYNISGIAVGAIVKADTLMNFIRKSSAANNTQYILTDKSGNTLSFSSQSSLLRKLTVLPNSNPIYNNFDSKYLIITEDMSVFQGRLSSVIENRNVFSGLEAIQWVIVVLGLVSIFIIPYVLYSLFRGIIKPVRQLVAATKEVEAGNWNFKLPRQDTPLEFITLNNSFESMVKEIKTLKIDTYEEKIERQKAELKYLQMQIKPHFYLNAVSTISSLNQQNRNNDIRRFIDLLSKHLRYMFKGGLVKVPIIEEIEHAKNYIQLQEIKYPNNIFYIVDIDPDLVNCLLPQFLIQTFVENIFKHALTIGAMLSIFIKTEKCTAGGEDFIRITVEDNGDGFSSEIIDVVNAPLDNTNAAGVKIGITNIKKTLSLLYKRGGLLKISNCDPKGARVEILIPIDAEVPDESTAN